MMSDPRNHTPFFIVGAPRSGTTLLQTLLDTHPALSIPPESHLFNHFGDLFSCYGSLQEASNLRRLAKDLLADERIKRWKMAVTPEQFCRPMASPDLAQVIDRLFSLYADLHGKERWGDKTPEHTLYMEQIHSVFPRARFIHLVRDGRDVVESLGRAFFGHPAVDRRARLWKDYVNAFENFRARHPELCLTVRYEDLVAGPPAVLKQVLEFLGEDISCVPEKISETSLKNIYLHTDEGAHQSLQQEVSIGKIGAYKKMGRRSIEIMESIMAAELKRCGYALETSGRAGPRAHEKAFFFLQHQLRFFKKWNHPAYLKDRFQYHVRRACVKRGGSR